MIEKYEEMRISGEAWTIKQVTTRTRHLNTFHKQASMLLVSPLPNISLNLMKMMSYEL